MLVFSFFQKKNLRKIELNFCQFQNNFLTEIIYEII
jgi:hypothetical protein